MKNPFEKFKKKRDENNHEGYEQMSSDGRFMAVVKK